MVNSSPKAARPTAPAPSGMDSYFEISKRGSTLGREVRGGLVTFFTMAYIIVLNPLIIGTTPDKAGNLITGVTPKQIDDMVEDGTLSGGMLPKIGSALDAAKNGVNGVHIIDGRVEHALLLEILTDHGVGTMIKSH